MMLEEMADDINLSDHLLILPGNHIWKRSRLNSAKLADRRERAGFGISHIKFEIPCFHDVGWFALS
jgi:hypothetical protein